MRPRVAATLQDIIYAIENKETFITILQGPTGTGKSTFV